VPFHLPSLSPISTFIDMKPAEPVCSCSTVLGF
jgi:hypothetical protein